MLRKQIAALKPHGFVPDGTVEAGFERPFKYNVPVGNRAPLMYKLTVGNQTFHGINTNDVIYLNLELV